MAYSGELEQRIDAVSLVWWNWLPCFWKYDFWNLEGFTGRALWEGFTRNMLKG